MPPPAYLDQRLHMRLDAFSSEQLDSVRALFVHDNPEYANWAAYRYSKFPPKKVVGTWKQSAGYLHVPRGRLLEVCQALSMEPRGSIDVRTVNGSTHVFKLSPAVEQRDYQLRLVDKAIEVETCLWRSPTASGKTIAAFLLIQRLGLSALVVVPNNKLLAQWAKRVKELFGFKPAIIQGKQREIGPITIASQATLLQCIDEVAPHFGVLICDEVHMFAAKTFNAIVEKSPARYRLGVSNDERRADGKEYLIHDQFGLPAATVERAELLAAGKIVDVAVRLVPTTFRLPWYSQLEPLEKFRTRHTMLDELQVNAERNAVILDCVRRCLDEGEAVAVLSDRREHCQILDSLIQQLCPVGQLLGGDADAALFDESLGRFASGELRAVVGTFKAIGVGFESHARLARGVFATPVATLKSARQQFMQYLGRFARAAAADGKTDAIVYLPFDPALHGDRPIKLVKSWVNRCEVLDSSGAFIPASDYLKGNSRAKAKRRSEASDQSLDPDDDLFKSRGRRSRA